MQDRIKQILINEQLSSSKFADRIGVQRSSVSHILSGRNNPSMDFIQKILSSFPNINADWLLTGKGKMYSSITQPTIFDMHENEQTKEVSEVTTSVPNNLFSSNIPQSEQNNSGNDTKDEKILLSEEDINKNIDSNKRIEKIVIFYTDKTFNEYKPE